jgi:hypothetical protein
MGQELVRRYYDKRADDVIRQGFDPTFRPPDADHSHAYLARLSEIEPLLRGAGLQPRGRFAAQGFVSMIDEGINRLRGPAWEAWVSLNLQLAAGPTLLSGAEHLLAPGRKG